MSKRELNISDKPLLTTTRNDLRNFLKIKKVSWVEDPTNES